MDTIRSFFSGRQLLCIGTIGFAAALGSVGEVTVANASEPIDNTLAVEDSDIAYSLDEEASVASYSTQANDLRSFPVNDILPSSDETLVAQDRMSDFGREQMEAIEVPAGNGEIISAIEVQFVDDDEIVEGTTRDFIITREFDLEPGDVYDPELAQDGLQRLTNLDLIRDASITLEPSENPGEAVMIVTVDERNGHFGLGFG
ncbi:MAG: POTRA domain-containing protein, partial [Cyanobacteria bacterium P01_A01_bin.37]